MNETIPPTNPSTSEARAAAEAELRAPPIPPSGQLPPSSQYQPYREGSPPSGSPVRGGHERQRVSWGVVAIGSVLVTLAVVMALGLVVAGILQGMAWAAGPVSATESRSFTVSGTPTLSLDVSAGNVHIVQGSDGQVTMTLDKQVQAVTHSAAEQALGQMSIEATQSANTISVHVGQPDLDGFPWVPRRSLDLTVSVPAATNLDLTMSAGNTDVTGTTGTLVGRVTAGNLRLVGLTVNGTSSLSLTAGNIDFRGALAPDASFDVSVTSGNADMTLPRTTPTHVQAGATAGNVSISGWPGVNTRHSGPNTSVSVDLNPPTTSTLSVQVTAGNVTVEPGA